MTKFKVLRKNEMFLNFVGIYLDPSSKPTNRFLAFFVRHYILISQLNGFLISAAFILKYPSDIKASMGALKVCVGVCQCAGMFLGVKNKLMKTKALQGEFQEIVDKGNYFNFCLSNVHKYPENDSALD